MTVGPHEQRPLGPDWWKASVRPLPPQQQGRGNHPGPEGFQQLLSPRFSIDSTDVFPSPPAPTHLHPAMGLSRAVAAGGSG